MTSKTPRGGEAAAITQATVATLVPSLKAFLENPFNDERIRHWYTNLAETCPYWGLQRSAYESPLDPDSFTKQVFYGEVPYLGGGSPWALMNVLSSDPATGVAMTPAITEQGMVWTVADPETGAPQVVSPADLDPGVAQRRLVRDYRGKLTAIKPDPVMERSYEEADNLRAVVIIRELRRLVTLRDAAKNQKPNPWKPRLKEFLRQLTGGKPGRAVSGLENLIGALAKECRVWLPAEAACRDIEPSKEAKAELAEWQFTDPAFGVSRLAFPFLRRNELTFVREREIELAQGPAGSREPKPLQRTAVFLLHARFSHLKLRTVGDYAYGDQFVEYADLTTNPLLQEHIPNTP